MSTYALIKYSEGRTSGEFDRRDFTHIHDKNLCMTVRSSPDIVVCIVQRNETKVSRPTYFPTTDIASDLEQCTLPVEHLINLSVEERQQSQAHTLNRDSLSIYGLTKGSQLALQWRMPGEAEVSHVPLLKVARAIDLGAEEPHPGRLPKPSRCYHGCEAAIWSGYGNRRSK